MKNKFRSVQHNDNLNDLCLLLIKLYHTSLEFSQPQRVIARKHFSSKALCHMKSLKYHLSDGSMEICER